ncbi:hypothetical protein [Pseudactinotalea terrae]|uniref:hypothetical protein n=1 Tax=Pseudactinotalea terrae TaxID=1743262 RepID=UPI0012E0EA0A|nr:hypothetical protein [Pseudactinotalea terrae]
MAIKQSDRTSVPAERSSAAPNRSDRLTVVGGWSLLAICALHTAVFAAQPWWGVWLAGPFRTEEPPLEAFAQFWALPGSFVVIGALLALSLISTGRRGGSAPLYLPIVLGLWAAFCVWIVGPSGFSTLAVPVTLLLVSAVRARRRRTTAARPR